MARVKVPIVTHRYNCSIHAARHAAVQHAQPPDAVPLLHPSNTTRDCGTRATVARQRHTIQGGGGKIQGPAKIC